MCVVTGIAMSRLHLGHIACSSGKHLHMWKLCKTGLLRALQHILTL